MRKVATRTGIFKLDHVDLMTLSTTLLTCLVHPIYLGCPLGALILFNGRMQELERKHHLAQEPLVLLGHLAKTLVRFIHLARILEPHDRIISKWSQQQVLVSNGCIQFNECICYRR